MKSIRNFRRLTRRPGSVLILVVALLVLMALIGTAYLSTTRVDRYTSQQHVANTQVELLMDGLKQVVKGKVIDGVFDTSTSTYAFRQAWDPVNNTRTYYHLDSTASDQWLASRVPQGPPAVANINWPAISAPLLSSNAGVLFESPVNATTYPGNGTGRTSIQPTTFTLPSGVQMPGLITPTGTFLGADTDADGIADAGLFRLPVGQINGLTYYAGMRIIDNNSAINASTAWKMNEDFAAAPVNNYGFFRSNIGLLQLLDQTVVTPNTYLQRMAGVNLKRFGNSTAPVLASPKFDAATPGSTEFNFATYGDALDHQLASRPTSPGYNATALYSWLGVNESLTLASKFCLIGAGSSGSVLETNLQPELVSFAGARSTPYSASDVNNWFGTNFNYRDYNNTTMAQMPLRALLVGSNPVSNAVPNSAPAAAAPGAFHAFAGPWVITDPHTFGDWLVAGGQGYVCVRSYPANTAGTDPANPVAGQPSFWEKVPWTRKVVKSNVNTAQFGELWMQFYNLMTEGTGTPPAYAAATTFRNPIRDPSATESLSPKQTAILRAAIAAINTRDLRDDDDDVTSRQITIPADPTASPARPAYKAMVYGTEKQPYISEVVAHVDTATPANNFLWVELCNPYPVAINLDNWQLGALNRAFAPTYDLTAVTNLGDMAGAIINPATATGPGTLVLRIGVPAAEPNDIKTKLDLDPVATPFRLIPAPLADAIGQELILFRPRKGVQPAGGLVVSTDRDNTFTETAVSCLTGTAVLGTLADMIPADQIDLRSLEQQVVGGPAIYRWYYRRGSAAAGTPWHFVYPGAYTIPTAAPGASQQAGFAYDATATTGVNSLDVVDGPIVAAPAPNTATATFLTIPLQLANTNMAGSNKPSTVAPHLFPFGGFARNGDILQIPFIGAYRLTAATGVETLVDMNCVSMDSAMADDLDLTDDPQFADNPTAVIPNPQREQIGRFCPVGEPGDLNAAIPRPATLDYTATPANWRYHWAKRIFDYFTVHGPNNDYFPNVDPAPLTLPYAKPYPGVSTLAVGNNLTEDDQGVEGLININTANWKVLSALPMLTPLTTTAAITTNENLAKAIALWRDGDGGANPAHGPFQTIYDLYTVPAFRLASDGLLVTEPDQATGDFSPGGVGLTDGVRYDFEERFLLLNRISNLITTRSDTFTCYLLLQGWRNAGTSNPELVVQRRAAFIVDRNQVTPSSQTLVTYPVP